MTPQKQVPVLVTGASGFIGCHLVNRLLKLHHPVSCLVRPNSQIDRLWSAGVHVFTGDVVDSNSVMQALEQSQAKIVFHLAGLVKTLRPDAFMSVNAHGVEIVSAACAKCKIPPVLIVVSSLAVAGPCAAGQLRTEADSPVPVSHYGRSKLAGEQAASKYAGIVPITIVRPPIVYGPGDRGMFEMFKPIARWGMHIVPGRAEHRYSLIHVDDLVEGLLLGAHKGERLSEHDSIGKGIYYLAGDECPTYTQIGQAIALALEKKPPRVMHLPVQLAKLVGVMGDVTSRIIRHPSWISRDKINEVLAGSWSCSSVKARMQLGWYPVITLPDGLRETALWYQQADWL